MYAALALVALSALAVVHAAPAVAPGQQAHNPPAEEGHQGGKLGQEGQSRQDQPSGSEQLPEKMRQPETGHQGGRLGQEGQGAAGSDTAPATANQ